VLHLPLIGCILWIGSGVQDLLISYHHNGAMGASTSSEPDASAGAHWGVVAAFASYLLICTVQQLLHRGIGRGARRVGKRKRLAVRGSVIALSYLSVYAYGAGWLDTDRWWAVWAYMAVVTMLAIFELYGRGQRRVSGDKRVLRRSCSLATAPRGAFLRVLEPDS
jgi:hypothetical protein